MTGFHRIALIGTGMVAQTHIDAIGSLGDRFAVSGVCARRPENAQAFAAKNGGLAVFETVAEISRNTTDFAIVATPPNARSEIVAHLCAAGVPILMEKPLERDLAAATALVEGCAAADMPLGVVFQHRTRRVVADLRGQLQRLGPVSMVEIAVPWWREQSYYDQPGRGTYAQDGGGVLITQAIHTLDLALSLTGPVRQVQAMAATTDLHRMEAEDFVTAGLRFDSGAVGTLFATTASYPGSTERITLHGPAGVAELCGARLTVTLRGEAPEIFGADGATGGGADPMAFTHDWHAAVIADFADALDTRRAPMVTGREALRVHALIEALTQSSQTGQICEVADV